jgi:hypothetical protein
MARFQNSPLAILLPTIEKSKPKQGKANTSQTRGKKGLAVTVAQAPADSEKKLSGAEATGALDSCASKAAAKAMMDAYVILYERH